MSTHNIYFHREIIKYDVDTFLSRAMIQTNFLYVLYTDMAKKYCRLNPTAIIAHFNNCAQYFDCREAVKQSFLRECRYPQLFDEVDMTCKNFSEVQCGARFVPQAPCKYIIYHHGTFHI